MVRGRVLVVGWLGLMTMVHSARTSHAQTPDLRDRLEARIYRSAAGEELPYRLFVPRKYEADKKYPLVVFLHGAGGRGRDNKSQLENAEVLRLIRDDVQAQHPCFLVAPQCPTGHQWVTVPWGLESPQRTPEKPSRPMRLLLELLDRLDAEFRIDPQRRYATGLSMGGFGTMDLLARRPDYWAAAVAVCGGDVDARLNEVAKIPLWVFHGSADTVVPPARTRHVVEAIRAAGGKPEYTIYPGVGHNCWTRAYTDPLLVDWLFAQKRP